MTAGRIVFIQLPDCLRKSKFHTLLARYCTAYLLFAIVKNRWSTAQIFREMTQILRLRLFAKTPMLSMLFAQSPQIRTPCFYNQLKLFD